MKQLRVFTSFSGYDSQCLALDRLGIDYDLVGWSEIDKYAIKAHDALNSSFVQERNRIQKGIAGACLCDKRTSKGEWDLFANFIN